MANPHFTRICQVCDTQYQATKTKSGNPRKTKYQVCSDACRSLHAARSPSQVTRSARMISKPCKWCGAIMNLTPSRAKTRTSCSRSCQYAIYRSQGDASRSPGFYCACCHKLTARMIRSSKDVGKFCCKKCSFGMLALIKEERDALKRIGQRRRSIDDRIRKEVVAPEVSALLRIAAAVRIRTTSCLGCEKSHIRRRKFSRFCTKACEGHHKNKMRELERQSESYKRVRRIAKSKRRALVRTTQVESIDPIDVFNRDKWVCHLCRRKTDSRLRGTCNPRAPELDHIISLAQGGTHTIGNVACSCRRCNGAKGEGSVGQLLMAV